jgi:hypothetical protein
MKVGKWNPVWLLWLVRGISDIVIESKFDKSALCVFIAIKQLILFVFFFYLGCVVLFFGGIFIYLFLLLFIYSHVHTLFGSFLLPAPFSTLSPPPLPFQNLFCALLLFLWRAEISNNKKDTAFLLLEIRTGIQRFLAFLSCTNVLQPRLINL